MNQLDSLDLDPADAKRIDEILVMQRGRGLAAEAALWRRRRRRWLTVWSLAMLLVVVLSVTACWPWWA